jgi:hypothetical protein
MDIEDIKSIEHMLPNIPDGYEFRSSRLSTRLFPPSRIPGDFHRNKEGPLRCTCIVEEFVTEKYNYVTHAQGRGVWLFVTNRGSQCPFS